MSARDAALRVLIACRRKKAWSDAELRHVLAQNGLDRRDAAFAARLCYGVLQNSMLLDWWIGRFVTRPQDLQPVVADILRLAVYQLRFFERVPASAAVNEAVGQAKRFANPKAAGLVNAVLRNMLRQPERLSLPDDLPTRYSHPAQLVELLRQNVGEELLEPLLRSHNDAPPTFLQTNTVLTDSRTLSARLTDEGYEAQAHPWLPDCLLLSGGNPEQSEAFRSGLCYVQDPAARLAVLAADPEPGMDVLDCCAAPGGKSFASAIGMNNQGSVLSRDLHPHKIELIRKGAQRLHLDIISAECRDASVPDGANACRFDVVLADVPCSGLGVIRKKPDIRYKNLKELEALPGIQRSILEAQSSCVRPGGVLLYSTCTILRRENEEVVKAFLDAHPEFAAEPFSLPGGIDAPEGTITLLPCTHDTDGFFLAKLRRTS